MKSFSNNKKHGILCKAAAFVMTFLLMFTTIAPNVSMFGGAGETADAATSDGNTYKVLGIMAEYSDAQWLNARNTWIKTIENRITSVSPSANITMKLVHSREFNCLNEDIVDNYDYVVVIINDKFTHIGGERYYTESQMSINGGPLKSVTSGNDITAKKLEELELFYDCGYPVEYLTLKNASYGTGDSNFKTKLGSSQSGNANETNVAKLYEYTKGDNAQIDGTHIAQADNRIKNVRSGKVVLDITSSPKDYDQGFANTGQETSKMLGYTFKINDSGSSSSLKRYTANFYIDMNNDGRFNEELEGLSYLGITLASNAKKNVESNALQANTEYRLTVNASKYVGLVRWKLVVSDNSDVTHRYSYREGACKLHLMKGQSKEKLRIIQLTASPTPSTISSQWTKNNVYLPSKKEAEWMKINYITRDTIKTVAKYAPDDLFKTDETATNSYIYSLSNSDQLLQNMYDFYQMLYVGTSSENGVLDYDIDIKRVYVNNLPISAGLQNSTNDWESIYKYLTDNYDMIIIGFADCYDDMSDVVCASIEAFIAEGKSVLFTHDTSSFVNTKKTFGKYPNQQNNNWGYNVNQKFRNMLGMDRFGVSLKDENGKPLTSQQRRAQGKDYNHTGYIQGYSDSTIESSVDNTNSSTGGQNNNYSTGKASRVNVGPITEYPYKIGSEIEIATTHTQYYQLDLESDDIVVWYALNGISGNKRYNDGRNNYYIYSKGNITYSGVGHSAGLKEAEVKLFTNTMIAAYRAGDSAVSMEVTDWDASTTDTTIGNRTYDYVTLPVDYIKKSTGGAYGESVVNNKSGTSTKQYRRVKFKVYDKTVAANKKVSIDFYTSSSKTDNQGVSKLRYYASSIYRMSDGKVIMKDGKLQNGQKLESGTEYYIYVPLSSFNTKQIFRGEIKATIKPSGQSNNLVITNSVFVNFNNRLQFNLG